MVFLAIDFGGTRLRAAWYNEAMQQVARSETLSQVDQPQEQVLKRIIDIARSVIPAGKTITAIGMAAPGPLDTRTGTIRHAKTLPGWENVPIGKIISEAFGGVSTWVENDANLAALAEYRLGAARGADPMVYLTLSTGIGGGAIIKGELFTGWSGLAIEPGHMPFMLPDGRVQRLETLASGTALGQIAQKRLSTTHENSLLRNYALVDGAAVGQAALDGDGLAGEIVREAGKWLGLGLVNLLHLFSPEVIVLGGSVSRLGNLLLDPVHETVQTHILDTGFLTPNWLRVAALDDDVCLVGAALLAKLRVADA